MTLLLTTNSSLHVPLRNNRDGQKMSFSNSRFDVPCFQEHVDDLLGILPLRPCAWTLVSNH